MVWRIEDPLGGSTASPRFCSSGALRSAGSLAALRFEVGRSLGVVGNALVLGFVLGKISAILGKISAILVLGRLASILRRPWDCLEGDVGGKLGPSGRLGRGLGRLGPSCDRLGTVLSHLGSNLGAKLGPSGRLGRVLGAS